MNYYYYEVNVTQKSCVAELQKNTPEFSLNHQNIQNK